MKPRRRMMNGLVYQRLADAVDVEALCDLQRDLMLHATRGNGDELTPERAELVAGVLRRGWRRLGDALITRLVEGDVLPVPLP